MMMLRMRSPKQIIKGAAVLSLTFLLYNEFLVYYVTLYSCNYPSLEGNPSEILNTMILADTHLLGSRNGHWFDKLRREWQMHRTFQTAVQYFSPEAVFFLGDIFDEGKWCPPEEFLQYMQRFQEMFYTGHGTKVYVVAGNHDIGFHYSVHPSLARRFNEAFKTRSVRQVEVKGVNFVLINSMAFQRDGCFLCRDAEKRLERVSLNLSCQKGADCSRPVLMSHFPLYRESDAACEEGDEAPPEEKTVKFREGWECISNASSQYITAKLRQRVAFSGHTHNGCRTVHDGFTEYTVSSFSWRNKKNPAFLLARFSRGSMAVSKCFMPDENNVILLYMVLSALILLLFIKFK